MLSALLAVSSFAFAGVGEDVRTAADTDLPTEIREAAFRHLADPTSTAAVLAAIEDKATPKEQRWVLIRSLGTNPSGEALDALLRMLSSTDALVRVATVEALGDRGDLTLTGKIAARLADPAVLVRSAAADALGRLKDPSTLGDLEHALADPTNTYRGASLWVRRQFVEAMGNIGGQPAVPYLGRAIDDTDPEVSRAAMTALEKIAGFSYKEGRSTDQEKEAWRRWAGR